eukprot:jgi/Tetstr1/443035/TSEL_031095.t1
MTPSHPSGCRRVGGHGVAYHPVVYHPDFQISPLPDDHRFPMPKDHLLYLRLQALGMATEENTFAPSYPDEDTLALCHDREYVQSFLAGTISKADMRKINLPWSPQLRQRTLIGTGSAILAARLALQWGAACMCNGGTHHAHRAYGGGWCIFNDQAVAARLVQRDLGVSQILFIDLDVHHGDGTAAIFRDDPSVFTFSMHCDDQAFPAVRPPSNLDIGLPAGMGDTEYLSRLSEALPRVLDDVQPQMVFYNAGVDPHVDDALGLLALTDYGIQERDRLVIDACAARRIPVAAAIGGGYSPDHDSIVERHVSVHRAARDALQANGPWGRVRLRPRAVEGQRD